ncbi:MAG: hypothetical protein KA758_16315 [Acidimicrobiales bacterium]|nr:hypothetical protein [Acidimicrobiales bacterium]
MKPGPSGPRRAHWLAVPHPGRLAPDHPRRDRILAAHDRAVALGLSTYLDPATGYTVLTAAYLADRGYCCSQGCRHCPWEGGDTDPEPEPGDGDDPQP